MKTKIFLPQVKKDILFALLPYSTSCLRTLHISTWSVCWMLLKFYTEQNCNKINTKVFESQSVTLRNYGE